jgi:hypothetical protein
MADWSPASPVERLTRALIINEQNQIHDRLINDSDLRSRYLAPFGVEIDFLLWLGNQLGATKLAFPLANSVSDPAPNSLLIYDVGDFASLERRINIGLDLFAGLLQVDSTRKLISTWVNANPIHHGTRVDYNPVQYSTQIAAAIPGGDQKWSPPLKYFQGQQPEWYDAGLAHTVWYRALYGKPEPLNTSGPAYPVRSRAEFDYENVFSLGSRAVTFTVAPLADLSEVLR